jgi:hypothetical protein
MAPGFGERPSPGCGREDEFCLDLHVHSNCSLDGLIPPAELVRLAVLRGLRGISLNDHNSVRGLRTAEEAARKVPGFILVPGIEISSRDGHMLALGVREKLRKGLSAEETFDAIVSAGGLPVATHPYRSFNGLGEDIVRRLGFPAIEVINARSPRYKNARSLRLNAELKRGITAGSDCHRPPELGRAFTIVPGEPKGMEEVLELIRRKRSWAGGRSATLREIASHTSKIGTDLLLRGGRRI